MQNYLLAFEALARHRTVGDCADLMEAFGFGEDKMFVVGMPGMRNITNFANHMEWNPEKASKVLVRFKGGPGAHLCGKSVFTATLVCFVVDRLLKALDMYGDEYVLNEIADVWDLKAA
jgi:hypothetical protein